MVSQSPHQDSDMLHQDAEEDDMLDADEAAEEIPEDEDADHPMSDDDEEDIQEEIQLVNDSIAHFDAHTSSIFCIAQHPIHDSIIATGGGDDIAYIFDTGSIPDGPVLPSSYESNPQGGVERKSIKPLLKLEGHTDSVNAITFTNPLGAYLLTAGLDGQLKAWMGNKAGTRWLPVKNGSAQEVAEINWLIACPDGAGHPNTVALGASDGSVWVYAVNAQEKENPLTQLGVYYLHTEASTAGAWSPDGTLLGSVSEDGSFHVWDVWGSGAAVVSLTGEDQRFQVEGGLYCVAMAGSMAAVGGAGGHIRIIGLPQTSEGDRKKGGAKESASSAGQILASLQVQTDGVETLSFSDPSLHLLASGSVDGSIVLLDTAHRFAVRRHIKEAHEEFAVVKVEFLKTLAAGSAKGAWILTSAGMDGVVRRWDTRGGTTAAGQGFTREWKGHRGDGEGGGVLGFVQGGGGERIVTAGDDGVALVFRGELP